MNDDLVASSDSVESEGRPGVDRRTLIKRAAAAGALAWSAPIIIDSLASPAAAQTGGGGGGCCPEGSTLYQAQWDISPAGSNGTATCVSTNPVDPSPCTPSCWQQGADTCNGDFAGGTLKSPLSVTLRMTGNCTFLSGTAFQITPGTGAVVCRPDFVGTNNGNTFSFSQTGDTNGEYYVEVTYCCPAS